MFKQSMVFDVKVKKNVLVSFVAFDYLDAKVNKQR